MNVGTENPGKHDDSDMVQLVVAETLVEDASKVTGTEHMTE